MSDVTSKVVFLTGVPAAGKSTAAEILKRQAGEKNVPLTFFNDYPYMIKWANEHRGDESRVTWFMQEGSGVENFNITPAAYPELSQWVATEIAKEIKGRLHEGGIFVLESARGAGIDGSRDRYDLHLFEPVQKILGDAVQYANIEMSVADPEIVLERMRTRLEADPTAPPVEVAAKYISTIEGVQSSFKQIAGQNGERKFAANFPVDNTLSVFETRLVLEWVMSELMRLNSVEGVSVHSKEGMPVHLQERKFFSQFAG